MVYNQEIQTKWEEIVDGYGSITNYAKKYDADRKDYDENFAEAVRIYTTNPDYLKTKLPEVYDFIKVNFPKIKN